MGGIFQAVANATSRRLGGMAIAALLTSTMLVRPALADDAASVAAGDLETSFENPPMSSRPRVWWHWMNGNVTKEGIAKDLEWMKRSGIGGMQNFDVNLATPQIVPNRLIYMTPEWKDAFRFAAAKADELGLELTIASSPGWSQTGGPWVKPQDGTKKVVWAETTIRGGRRFTGVLPVPPSTSGPFHDASPAEDLNNLAGGDKHHVPTFYADTAVLAYRVTDTQAVAMPRMRLDDGKALDAAVLNDGSFATGIVVPQGSIEKPTTVYFDYDREQTVRSATIFVPGAASTFFSASTQPRLEASDDGQQWRKVALLTLGTAPTTVSFAPVTARRYRVVLAELPPSPVPIFTPAPGIDPHLPAALFAPKAPTKIVELNLSPEPRVNYFQAKAGFSVAPEYYALDAETDPDLIGVPAAEVIDLTSRMRPDGRLDWSPPRGDWRVIRMGYSLTGKINHPAPAEATGLEVDKLDREAVRRYTEAYLGNYRDAVGTDLLGSRGVRALLHDSTEVGAFNWTPRILEEFKGRRGYDARPWLPTLTGAIIGSRRDSDKFLYDFRQTLAELHASAHYGTVAQVAHEHGLKVYGEALEGGRPSLGDDIDMRKYADYPMAALWTFPRGGIPLVPPFDIRGAASAAHVFGKNVVAAESMTSALHPWGHVPSDLRRVIDLEFAHGVNLPVIHTSVHQPTDDKQPGLSLGVFGQYFNRHESWAELARPWMDYLARNSHMLQQGRFVADVGYFYGEEAPIGVQLENRSLKGAPTRYAYDLINPSAVHDVLKVDKGDLIAPSGARYRLLYLGGSSQRMTLRMLRRLASLVESGATLVGAAPTNSPALGENSAQYTSLVRRLWSGQPVTKVGKGQVIAETDVERALAMMEVVPDFEYTKSQPDSDILFVHRRLDGGDLYYVNNRNDRVEKIEARFRVTGKLPEIWRADTGKVTSVSYRIENGVTVVPLEMEAEDSFFVVFRKPAVATSLEVARPDFVSAAELSGAWKVAFQSGRGAPATAELPSLGSLSEQSDPGVKYFSGLATYTKRFTLPKGAKPGGSLLLDLGKVGDLAEITVNGKLIGSVWHAPFQLDIGHAVKRGANTLQVEVANVWVNRLIGDMQPGAKKVTYTSLPTYSSTAPLRPAGLMGPVRLLTPSRPTSR